MHQAIACGGRSASPVGSLAASIVTTTTLVAAFGGLALGVDGWWIAFPLGFGAGMPLAMGLAKAWADRDGPRSTGGSAEDAEGQGIDEAENGLATLRERYARGEIDEVEFERRVETLLAAEDRVETGSRTTAGGTSVGGTTADATTANVDGRPDDR